jgi:hypothetical protein
MKPNSKCSTETYRNMKDCTLTLAGLALALSIVGSPQPVRGQGSLTPPGAPAPTMKTLAQLEPRTPISSLPYTITNPGSYYLTTNLTRVGGTGNGISFSCGDITLDLNGFYLQGVSNGGSGIFVTGSYTNLVVRNGSIIGWGSSGIDSYTAAYPRGMLFEKLMLTGNGASGILTEAGSVVRDCVSLNNGLHGISTVGSEIIHCTCRANSEFGISATYSTIRECRSEYNGFGGLDVEDSRVLDCAVEYNSGEGVLSQYNGHNEVRRCRVISSASGGIISVGTSGAEVIADCVVENNTSYGIQVNGPNCLISGNHCVLNTSQGIVIGSDGNRIDGNMVLTPNGVVGIGPTQSGYSHNVTVRNYVSGGGSDSVNYGLPTLAGSDYGPVGPASTATSPWANISH